VLMVTGAYFPELSGGGLQARAVVRELSPEAEFIVLTTSIQPSLPAISTEEGVPIYRVHVDPASAWSQLIASARLISRFVRLQRRFDVVNVHGFSRKAVLFRLLSILFRKRLALTLQTGGHDEPAMARAAGRLADWAYRGADLYLSVSPGLSNAYLAAGLPPRRLRQVCNAVDVGRFRPASDEERVKLRDRLGWPGQTQVVLFVGYFSRDKRPEWLFDAWRALPRSTREGSMLVFVGATRASYAEIDPTLVERIRESAAAAELSDRVRFVESTWEIDDHFRASDVYVLPSLREGLPIALLEAMATGLPCIATAIAGSTDVLIRDGETGVLVPHDDRAALTCAIDTVLRDRDAARRLGAAARREIESRYSIQKTSRLWLDAYRSIAVARP